MKRLAVMIMVLVVVTGGTVFAQDTGIGDLETYKSAFSGFSDDFAASLPMNSTIGLNWSDAYIGQLLPVPSFGVGVTTGMTTIPLTVFEDLAAGLDPDGADLGDLPGLGIPLPGYAFDARVGGLILPFDVGLKFGTIGSLELGDVEAEYTNFGVDVRYAVLDGGVLPKVSVGVGYNYLSGRIATPLGFGTTELASIPIEGDTSNTATVSLTDPQLDFDWTANVVDVKAQVSKSFLIVEPHFGLGAAFGSAKTNAGLASDVEIANAPAGTTLEDLESIAGVSIGDTGISVGSDVSTFSLRAFGGMSLNLTVLRFDLGVMYNLTSGSLGGTLGARFQI